MMVAESLEGGGDGQAAGFGTAYISGDRLLDCGQCPRDLDIFSAQRGALVPRSSAFSQDLVLAEMRKRPDRPGKVPSMYLGRAHFLEEALEAFGQPSLWGAKTNNMPEIVPKFGSILAQFINRALLLEVICLFCLY
jgi:hypothetical protein